MSTPRPESHRTRRPTQPNRRLQGARLDGQVALVTGGSSGIGKGVAVAPAEAGADVAVNYRGGKEGADEVVAAIRELGRLDILVNNAGIQMDANIEEMTLEQWQTVIGVNLTGQFLCAREAVRHFKE